MSAMIIVFWGVIILSGVVVMVFINHANKHVYVGLLLLYLVSQQVYYVASATIMRYLYFGTTYCIIIAIGSVVVIAVY